MYCFFVIVVLHWNYIDSCSSSKEYNTVGPLFHEIKDVEPFTIDIVYTIDLFGMYHLYNIDRENINVNRSFYTEIPIINTKPINSTINKLLCSIVESKNIRKIVYQLNSNITVHFIPKNDIDKYCTRDLVNYLNCQYYSYTGNNSKLIVQHGDQCYYVVYTSMNPY